jgi:hypothetical protein
MDRFELYDNCKPFNGLQQKLIKYFQYLYSQHKKLYVSAAEERMILQLLIWLQSHPRSQGLTADTALPEALAKTKTGTSKIL